MKIYFFNFETGLYEGESFEDANILAYETGVTNVAPPSYEKGQVPIFDSQTSSWTVLPVDMARKRLTPCSGESK